MTLRATSRPVIVGTGLVVLDITVDEASTDAAYPVWAGGTCGNVLAILASLGWRSRAVGRIGEDAAGAALVRDLLDAGVETAGLEREASGTPVILHRLFADKRGAVKHGYRFECPQCNSRYPSFRPILSARVDEYAKSVSGCSVMFFDRVSRGVLDLVDRAQRGGALIVFEPSASGDERHFVEAYELSHVVKYARDRKPKFEDALRAVNARRRPALEVETRGAEGLAFRLDGDKRWRSRGATQVRHFRDAAGAGDWLTAGLLHALIGGGQGSRVAFELDAVEAALALGEALAAFNCQFPGPRGAMYASALEGTTEMLVPLDAKMRRKITAGLKRPSLQMTLTGVCKECAARMREAAVAAEAR